MQKTCGWQVQTRTSDKADAASSEAVMFSHESIGLHVGDVAMEGKAVLMKLVWVT